MNLLSQTLASICIALSLVGQQRPLADNYLSVRQGVANLLVQALEKMEEADWAPSKVSIEHLCLTLESAASRLPEGSMAQSRLSRAVARARESAADQGLENKQAWRSWGRALRSAVEQLAADLTFRPYMEAPLPEGFPAFRAIDEVEIKSYPAYRMAKTTMNRVQDVGAFWVLFNHIKDRDIAMTAPVQVDYSEAGQRQQKATMGFLYRTPNLGPTGPAGRADVVDVEPTMVVSIGASGQDRRSRVAELQERLEAWLRSAKQDYKSCGPMRVLTHNGPMVRGKRRYFEVQIPIQPVERTESN